jgi:hypothetical protein
VKIISHLIQFFPTIVVLLLLSCSTKSTDNDVAPPPPPAAVTDLRVTDTTPTTVALAWTAPENDENHGSVNSYDLRYTTSEPEESNWDSAIQIDGEPPPLPGGFTQTMTVMNLEDGLTYYFALKCIGEQGSISEISNLVEVTLTNDFEVLIPDAAFESVLREIVNKPTGALLFSDIVTINDIQAENRGITDITGIEHCDSLVFLNLADNNVSDISALSELPKLADLNLGNNKLTDIGPLAGIETLGHLGIGMNQLSDIDTLSALTGLTIFAAQYNDIEDISALQYMTDLQIIVLSSNNISDLNPLQFQTRIDMIDLTSNNITDISPLLTNTGLSDGDSLYLYANPLSQTTESDQIPELEARGVTVFY